MASGAIPVPAFGDPGQNYLKLPNGALIQWGYVSGETVTSGNSYLDVVVTYPVPFHESTGVPVVVPAAAATGAGTDAQANVCIPAAIYLYNRFTQFTLRIWKQASVGTANNPSPVITWVAFGRWK